VALSPGLAAKLEHLKNAQLALRPRTPGAGLLGPTELGLRETSHVSRLQTELGRLNVEDQADYLLSLLLVECGATVGRLYRVGRDGRLAIAATRNAVQPSEALTHTVLEYYADFDRLDEAATQIAAESRDDTSLTLTTIEAPDGRYFPVPCAVTMEPCVRSP
jgi:hypothetical protein